MRFFRSLSDVVTCERCTPIDRAVRDEHAIVKHESLIVVRCSVCGALARDFLKEPPKPVSDGERYRRTMKRLEKAGKAYPVAGDLFDDQDDGRA